MRIKRRREARRKFCILLFRRNIRRAHDDGDDDDDDGGDGNGDGTVLAVFLLCILCCASLPMRENPEEVPTYLVHCTTCETSTSSCFLRPAPTIPHTTFFVPFSLAYFTLREIISARIYRYLYLLSRL